MASLTGKTALVSGASIAGLATAYWLNKLGCRVTVVELAPEPRVGGAAVNIEGNALAVARQMGIFEQLRASRLHLTKWEFRNEDDTTANLLLPPAEDALTDEEADNAEIEIERDKLVSILLGSVGTDLELLFNDTITALHETGDALTATFKNNPPRTFDLVFGCDGLHSGVRKIWFGHEAEYVHFLKYYFSLTIVPKLLLAPGTAQMYNTPGKAVLLNAYNGKTDIIFTFFSEQEISYDYRDAGQQQEIVQRQFAGDGWRTAELLAEVAHTKTAYFDKICQVKMPSWTKGRVALVGDAGYCASPAAGRGASLALEGAAAVAEALAKHGDNFEAAFEQYNQQFRPFVEEVQDTALYILSNYLIPGTEEAIRERNSQESPF